MIIIPHIDSPQSTGYNFFKWVKKKQKSEGAH